MRLGPATRSPTNWLNLWHEILNDWNARVAEWRFDVVGAELTGIVAIVFVHWRPRKY